MDRDGFGGCWLARWRVMDSESRWRGGGTRNCASELLKGSFSVTVRQNHASEPLKGSFSVIMRRDSEPLKGSYFQRHYASELRVGTAEGKLLSASLCVGTVEL